MPKECPECGCAVGVPSDAVSGEIVRCPDCGTDLEVELDYFPWKPHGLTRRLGSCVVCGERFGKPADDDICRHSYVDGSENTQRDYAHKKCLRPNVKLRPAETAGEDWGE